MKTMWWEADLERLRKEQGAGRSNEAPSLPAYAPQPSLPDHRVPLPQERGTDERDAPDNGMITFDM